MAPHSTVTPPSAASRTQAPPLPPPVTGAPPRTAASVAAGAVAGGDPKATHDRPTTWTTKLSRSFRPASSCLISLVFHAVLIIVLGVWGLARTEKGGPSNLVASLDDGRPALVERIGPPQPDDMRIETAPDNQVQNSSTELSSRIQADLDKPRGAAGVPLLAEVGIAVPEGTGDLLHSFAGDADVTGSLAARLDAKTRAELVEEGGGTPRSEDAVSRGLRWLEVHQNRDGSWRFNLADGQSACTCGDPGDVATTTAATGLALLAFLGRGHTHRTGEYQNCVKDGLYYLMSRLKLTPHGGDLQEGTMYAQGIAAIALAEAYALTRDEELEEAAQQAIDFIVFAQHKQGGGWRYVPGMPGDTTVTGWQLMALKSGQMAYLRVPADTIQRAIKFLDSVQLDKGARYRYLKQDKDHQPWVPTAVGLLCRMYTGWDKEHPALQHGVELLSGKGPSTDNMYYNYYGTQVMHHWGGTKWENWNYVLREHLIETQARDGHESGSWYFAGGEGKKGGRLYNTAMAVMTLEVYYRHLPIYRAEAAGDGF